MNVVFSREPLFDSGSRSRAEYVGFPLAEADFWEKRETSRTFVSLLRLERSH